MERYEQARDALAEALAPVAAYVERAHATVDAADPAHAARLRHVTQVEALVEAVADFGEVVDPHMGGPDWKRLAYLSRLGWRCQAFVGSPRMQVRAALPLEERRRLAAISCDTLPRPRYDESDARPL